MNRYTAAILVAACTLVFAQSQPDSMSLLTTGSFHADEVTARSGDRWLGLLHGPSGYMWKVVALKTRRVNDPVGEQTRERTGIEVSAAGNPILLTKGIIGLLGTTVRTVLDSPDGLALPEKDALELGAYRIRVIDRRLGDSAPEKPSRLVLESEGKSQILYEWSTGLLDQHCELLWAGDLDGDGKLDLFMILSDHYNVMERTLFLSSKRSIGEFVKRVASFVTAGC
jgi:hypothetical protein